MGNEPSKQAAGTVCTSASQCESGKCAKPCRMTKSQWNGNKDVDHWNWLGYCSVQDSFGWGKGSLQCMRSNDYKNLILLKADGKIDYKDWSKGTKTKWNKKQCFKNINCDASTTTYQCHQYTDGQSDSWCGVAGPPYVFTGGVNADYPGCGSCWCCEEVVAAEATTASTTDALTMADTATPGAGAEIDTLALDAFALIGLIFVLLFVFRRMARLVTKPSSIVEKVFTPVPTEKSALETSHTFV